MCWCVTRGGGLSEYYAESYILSKKIGYLLVVIQTKKLFGRSLAMIITFCWPMLRTYCYNVWYFKMKFIWMTYLNEPCMYVAFESCVLNWDFDNVYHLNDSLSFWLTYISVLCVAVPKSALWDMEQVHCGICEIGILSTVCHGFVC